MAWTEERIEQLRQLWLEGRSCSQIAAALGHGLTRNGVIGKVHRLGLAGRARGSVPASPRVPKTSRARRQFNGLKPSPVCAPRPVIVPVPIECVSVSLIDLNQGMCKWPMGEDCYCGNPAPWRAAYCAGHSGVAYQPGRLRSLERLVALT